MHSSTTVKLFHQLHYCMNLLHRGHGPHGPHGGRGGAHRGQGRVLALLAEQDGQSPRDLAALLRVQPPSLSELLDKLSRDGSIERRRNEEDQRMSAVFLTDKGRAVMDEARQARRDAADATLAGLSAEEQEALSLLLDKLIASLEAREGEGCRRMGGPGHGRGRGRHGCCGGEDTAVEGGRGGQHGHGPHGHAHHGPHEHGPHGQGCRHAAHGPEGRADAEDGHAGCCGHGRGGQGGRGGRGRHDGFGPHGPRGAQVPNADADAGREPEALAAPADGADAERDA